jgi:hypothetical protein
MKHQVSSLLFTFCLATCPMSPADDFSVSPNPDNETP